VDNRVGSKVLWWLLLVLTCAHFCLAYLQNSQPFLNLDEYMHGASRLPYQYRALMAWVLQEGLRVPRLAVISALLPVPIRDPRLLILFVTSWLSLLGSVLFTWRSLSRLTGNEQYSRWASLLVVYMAYFQFPLVFGLDFLLPYDLPSLFFFCGCLYCIILARMRLFYLFFVVGTFNRETICMVTLLLVLWRWQELRRRGRIAAVGAHVLAQASIWFLINIYLHHLFAGNAPDTAGASFYYKLGYNLRTIIKPQQWPILLSVFGFSLPFVAVWRGWMKNEAMERSIYLLPAWFAVMMMVGVIVEIRIFSELISYMAIAVGLIAYRRLEALQRLGSSWDGPERPISSSALLRVSSDEVCR
jgi:hypothetical protein